MPRAKRSRGGGSGAELVELEDTPGSFPGTDALRPWSKGHAYWSQVGHGDHSAYENGGVQNGRTPLIQAVMNPFSLDALVRIPDSVATSFCLQQSATCVTVMPSQSSAQAINHTMHCGFALRPSAADGTVNYFSNAAPTTAIPIQPDAFLVMGMGGNSAGIYPTKGAWYQYQLPNSNSGHAAPNLLKSYNWHANALEWDGGSSTLPLVSTNTTPNWLGGLLGFMRSYGIKARPVVWAIWCAFEGLNDTSQGQVLIPAGQLYFGLRNTTDNSGESFGSEAVPGNTFNVLNEAVDKQPFYDLNGPSTTQSGVAGFAAVGGTPWQDSLVNNNIMTQLIGSITLAQFKDMPHGFIISASFTGPDDIVWRDIAYWSGENRYYDTGNFTAVTTVAAFVTTGSNVFDMVGIQPFIFYEGGINMKIRWRFTISWEIQPGQQGYVLPGKALGRARPDRGQFDAFTAFMSTYQAGIRPIEPTAQSLKLRSSAMG